MSMLGQELIINCGPGRTKQSFRDKCDINKIIAKHRRSGMIDHLNGKKPFYGDVSQIADYASAINVVNNAEKLFSNMSSEIRERFGNDPVKMIKFLENKNNIPEAIKLGMVLAKPEAAAEPAQPAPGAPEDSKPAV